MLSPGHIELTPAGVRRLSSRSARWVLADNEFRTVQHLSENVGARFKLDDQDRLLVTIRNVTVEVRSRPELFILREVLAGDDYHFECPQEAVIIDIGMNVGFTSLLLASLNPNALIYSYEPVTNSFNQALSNIQLNPGLSERIRPHNYGLGATSRHDKIQVEAGDYGRAALSSLNRFENSRKRGSPSLRKSTKRLLKRILPETYFKPDKPAFQESVVEIRDVRTELTAIASTAIPRPLVAKIDCEGAELEIIDRLSGTGLLSTISFCAMEWHRIDGQPTYTEIADQFRANGFTLNVRSQHSHAGMLYAYNTKLPT